jgi:hypothetical protein
VFRVQIRVCIVKPWARIGTFREVVEALSALPPCALSIVPGNLHVHLVPRPSKTEDGEDDGEIEAEGGDREGHGGEGGRGKGGMMKGRDKGMKRTVALRRR